MIQRFLLQYNPPHFNCHTKMICAQTDYVVQNARFGRTKPAPPKVSGNPTLDTRNQAQTQSLHRDGR
jgi:hypothetical protein